LVGRRRLCFFWDLFRECLCVFFLSMIFFCVMRLQIFFLVLGFEFHRKKKFALFDLLICKEIFSEVFFGWFGQSFFPRGFLQDGC
jgi:Fe2+ transport system protein B